MGPCLCGDPACGWCFPSGQVHIECPECGWEGKVCDIGFTSDEDSEFDVDNGCPKCGTVLEV